MHDAKRISWTRQQSSNKTVNLVAAETAYFNALLGGSSLDEVVVVEGDDQASRRPRQVKQLRSELRCRTQLDEMVPDCLPQRDGDLGTFIDQ
jgi:hypothetical protein